jgi:porin
VVHRFLAACLLGAWLPSADLLAQGPVWTGDGLAGPDAHEHPPEDRGHVFGDWGGRRTRLFDDGVTLDVQYLSDSLWNVSGRGTHRVDNWSRVRGTIDIDFGRLTGHQGLYFHATAVAQGGANIGQRLGLTANPSGLASEHTFRLDSWWIEKRFLRERFVVRAGQFAGQDFYGTQHYAASFIVEPLGYAFGNLFNTHEAFDPPSTTAAELRVIPRQHFYLKTMVMAGDPDPFAHNPTGFVPQFRGSPVTVAEIGFTPGQPAVNVRGFDNVASRRRYSGLYKIGGAYNPATFTAGDAETQRPGNYLLYVMASQALWRSAARGIDATAGYDWSPADVNEQNRQLTAGIRVNEPLALRRHHTMSVGYVRSFFSRRFRDAPPRSEHGVEANALVEVTKAIVLQPVIQYFANPGGGGGSGTVVFGVRTKVDF